MATLKKSYSLFGIFAIFVLLLVPPTSFISINPLSSPDTASAATGTGSIVLNGVQTTSKTVSSAPYQVTISNFNAGTGTNRLLVVGVDANNNNVASVTFGGVPLTNAAFSFSNNDAEFWYLANPSGTGNIVVTMTGATSAVVGAYSFSGVDQTTPIPTSITNHNAATASSPTVSITTQYPNSWVLDLPSIYGGKTLGSPTCTQQWDITVPNAITGASSSTTQSSTGSVTCSWTASGGGDLWDDAAIEIKSSGTGTTATVPGSPTGLTATSVSTSQINLSWTAPSSNGGSAITGYKIERSTDSGTTWSTVQANTGSTGTTYSDTGLAASTTYTYRVYAINSVGTSSPSNTASATTSSIATTPGSPSGLTATAGNSQISLSWSVPSSNGGSAITGYRIYRSIVSGGEGTMPIATVSGSTLSYTDSGLTNGITYFYKVTAVNSIGESASSNEASATPAAAATVPSSPTGLTAAAASTSQINLSWTAPSNNGGSAITGYKIERSTDSGTTWSTVQANTASTSTTYSDTGLTANTAYTYRVSAINSVGTGSPSNTASATTSGTTTNSIVLNNVQTTSGTISSAPYQVTISNFNAGIGTNRLLVVGVDANNNAVTSVTFGGVPLTNTAFSFTNNDAEFWYLANPSSTGNIVVTMAGATSAVVGAYSFSGIDQTTPIPTSTTNHNAATSASSPTISITTKNPNSWVLDLPSIYGGKTLGSPTCTQQWDINIANAITGASSSTSQTSAGSVTCNWTASGGGDAWDDVAIEIKSSGTGTTATVPGSPTGLTAAAASTSQINLSWTAPSSNGGSAITGYKIERSTDGGTTWSTAVANTASTSTTYSDTGLTASTTYTYRVSAINSVGTSTPSNTASATTGSTSNVRAISLSTSSVNVGTDVRITGTKFAPNSQITISYDSTAIGVGSQDNGYSTTPLTIKTDSNGNFVAIMSALVSVTGTHIISAQDASKNTASQSITISPHVYIFPTSGKAGSLVLIPTSQGNGYAASSSITIKFDGTTIAPAAAITSDVDGNFEGNFTIPSGALPGSHTITISDAKGDAFSTSFNVDPNAHAFSAQTLIKGLNFPAYFAFIPDTGPGVDGSGAFMVNEKNTGNVLVFKNVNGQFVKQTVPFVKVPNLQTNYETNGLLGVAFDPNWATSSASQYVYFYVTRTVSNSVVGELIRYHATTDSSGNIIADKSVGEQLVLGNIPAFNNGHNGGTLKFDSQGNLYISTGDGWTFTAGQDLTTLQGKVLHITPLASPMNGKLYSIPSTNPFVSSTNTSIKKEIWAYGVRNPYTFDVDSQTGKLYASDVGFNTWDRIEDLTTGGTNAGWDAYESPPVGNPQNLANYTPQVYWYPHQGVEPLTGPTAALEAISAGAFYHGTPYPNLNGAYIFGDYGVGFIAALLPSSVAPPTTDPASGYPIGQAVPLLYGLNQAPIYMQEWNGKLYFMDLNGDINVLNYN